MPEEDEALSYRHAAAGIAHAALILRLVAYAGR